MRLSILTASAALALTVGAPAFAQSLTEVTVVGEYSSQDGKPASLSRPVSFADLNLTQEKDQKILKQRIRLTARDLCMELGEPDTTPATLGRSCRTIAERNALAGLQQVASADSYGVQVSDRTNVVTNGPVPDTKANRAAYGGPASHAGRATAAKGN